MKYKTELTDEGKDIRDMLRELDAYGYEDVGPENVEIARRLTRTYDVLVEAALGNIHHGAANVDEVVKAISKRCKASDRRIYMMIAWGWIDIYADPTPGEIADRFMLSGYAGPHGVFDEVRTVAFTTRMAQELVTYTERVAKRSGVRWHFDSCRITTTGRTLIATLVAAGGRRRNVFYSGSWQLSR